MRLTDLWKELVAAGNVSSAGNLDVLYYLMHMFMNPIDQLFSTAYGKTLKALKLDERISFSPRSNISYSCLNPMKMLTALIRHTNAVRLKAGKEKLSNDEMSQICTSLIVLFENAYDEEVKK